MVSGTQKSAVTDGDGEFEIKGLAYGNYTLQISSMEAKAKTVNVTVNKPNVQITISVEKDDPKALKKFWFKRKQSKRNTGKRFFCECY